MKPRFFSPEPRDNVDMRYLGGTPHFDIVLYEHVAERGGNIYRNPADRFIVCAIPQGENWLSMHGVERFIAYAEHGGAPREYCEKMGCPHIYQKQYDDHSWSQSSTTWGAEDAHFAKLEEFVEELPLMGQIVKLFSGVV